ncbi:hypothetical protein ElyMa_005027100 [Elysia marginata]|uniref:PiggyBac transposable element-derived protein domain-containing protein n=1 Tax=Elysia marginata TaxID=1093978 RepID=A0AAV4JA05_9GAST|nr:hypothetical protein ElyMa_005027100 [Elysia marginata]
MYCDKAYLSVDDVLPVFRSPLWPSGKTLAQTPGEAKQDVSRTESRAHRPHTRTAQPGTHLLVDTTAGVRQLRSRNNNNNNNNSSSSSSKNNNKNNNKSNTGINSSERIRPSSLPGVSAATPTGEGD